MSTLHQAFIAVAKRQPGRLAIIDRTRNAKLTYGRALIASLILANRFRKLTDHFVGVMVPNSAGSVLSVLGTLMAGKVPVMINYSTGAEANIAYARKKCGFHTVITSKALLEKINCPVMPGMILLEEVMASLTLPEKLLAAVKSKLPVGMLQGMVHRGEADDDAVILLTSGSEKDPKAVELTHRNIGANVVSIRKVLTLTVDDIILANLPFFHVFGQTVNLWLPLMTGMTLVSYANPLEYRTVCTIVREEKVTLMVGTPAFFSGYLRQSAPGDFASVRIMVAGADKVPDSLRAGFRDKHGKELCEGYGATETSPVVSVNVPGANKPGSIGRLLSGVQVKIEDVDTGQELPVGREGKIMVKGELVMKGYLNDAEETARRIKDGWYETGDMGMMDEDGYLWHRGRLKRFVKIGGEMVSLVRVETVLQELLPEDIDCTVVDVPDPVKGARIVAVTTAEINHQEIQREMALTLPHLAIPKDFLVIEELPKLGSGKVDFRAVGTIARERIAPHQA
jgi:acyl-[acyl-carrier-protein]-phospholipid O-acyltransferase/long-chain-fatty-acid--[acyl-carrier-protein] ligase